MPYVDYYKEQYNMEIKDLKQPLLISRKEVRISGEAEKREYTFSLIPELCNMTGLSDDQKNNYNIVKDVATYTKLKPMQRVKAYKDFLKNVNETPEAKDLLSAWGLTLESDPTKVEARVLDEEKIVFGRNKEFSAGPMADFTRHATSNEVIEPINLQNWLLVYVKRANSEEARKFEEMLMQVSRPTGITVSPSRRIELENDRTTTFIEEIQKALKGGTYQIVVIILPSLLGDRYAAVKKLLCVSIPIPSQVIQGKTLRNDAKNRSIVTKIILQMNAKMGGSLWSLKIPLKKTMICGIDTYHEAGPGAFNVAGFVASFDSTYTHWFSNVSTQKSKEELVNGLTVSMEMALTKYHVSYDCPQYLSQKLNFSFQTKNNEYPETIIVYRDGVGDGQLAYVESYEIPQMKEAFSRISSEYKPKLTFIVVQKRINEKIYTFIPAKTSGGADRIENPAPGTVLDHTITNKFLYDFYMCSQHVREGTTTPSHFIVLVDERPFPPDIIQKLSYKLCYLYYNWPGTVRVPAPCQYAHKLCTLVGESIKKEPSNELNEKLYFL